MKYERGDKKAHKIVPNEVKSASLNSYKMLCGNIESIAKVKN